MKVASGFLAIDRVVVPRLLVDAAQLHLRAMGVRGSEGFALWVGQRSGNVFNVRDTIIPRQTGLQLNGGVCITVDAPELFRINRYLYEANLSLIAQIHSHPGEAYHSYTDDSFPIATTIGALSLVIPDFAVRAFALEECAVYRLETGGTWAELGQAAVRDLIEVVE